MSNRKMLERKLRESVEILEVLNENFDNGHVVMGNLIAVELRKLFYNNKNKSVSLLKQLDLENTIPFMATKEGLLNRFTKLIKTTNDSVVPCLDSEGFKKTSFEDWWSKEPVSIAWADDKKNSYSREEIVKEVANKHGAHIDKNYNEKNDNFITGSPIILSKLTEINLEEMYNEILGNIDIQKEFPKIDMQKALSEIRVGDGEFSVDSLMMIERIGTEIQNYFELQVNDEGMIVPSNAMLFMVRQISHETVLVLKEYIK